ncbi:hypothetical protein SH1V18_23090 [Vallitalea longa]|uniref:Uncharacterized protein n=1 Tax=Vallitalea longa TaxID=2936439 RepID=A0A9W5YDB9_9FIRM|nr:hypothetical protein [Vallitalea longa]GKX29829.1 hypothetical protein SH1V18_23090 [Vallitalea longa]
MEDFEKLFNDFLLQMQILTYREFTQTDIRYKETENYLNDLQDEFNRIINSLSDENKKFVRNYIDKESFKTTYVYEYMYLSGYRDCIKLLRKLNVLR